MKYHVLIALALMFVVGLTVPDDVGAKPSASDGKREIQKQIDEESEGRIELLVFRKTNGQQREVFGRQIYVMEFEAEIQYTEMCRADFGYFGVFNSFKTIETPEGLDCSCMGVGCPLEASLQCSFLIGPEVEKGRRETISGTMTFEKMEKGWRVISQMMQRELR